MWLAASTRSRRPLLAPSGLLLWLAAGSLGVACSKADATDHGTPAQTTPVAGRSSAGTGGSVGPGAGRGGTAAGGGGTAGGSGGSGTTSGGTAGRAAASGGSDAASAGSAATSSGGTAGHATASGGSDAASAGAPAAGESNGAGTGGAATSRCDNPSLVWRSANKTNYTSYPDPGSPECIEYNGCMWAGQFAACDAQKSEAWVSAHDIVAAFPDFDTLKLHDLCLRKGQKTIVVTVLDTCGDSDCSGCCTQNRGSADELIDVESYTNERWGVPDGAIEWADLGATTSAGCN